MTDAQPDFYAILGIARTATLEEIKKRYHERAKKLHPDPNTGGDETELKKIIEAYETLSNPDRRTDYDRKLKEEAQTAEASQAARERAEKIHAAREARAPSAGQAQAYGDRIRNQAGGSRTSSTGSTAGYAAAGSSTTGRSQPPRQPPPPPPRPTWFQEGMRTPSPPVSPPEYQPRRVDPLRSAVGLILSFLGVIIGFIATVIGGMVMGLLVLWGYCLAFAAMCAVAFGAFWLFIKMLGHG